MGFEIIPFEELEAGEGNYENVYVAPKGSKPNDGDTPITLVRVYKITDDDKFLDLPEGGKRKRKGGAGVVDTLVFRDDNKTKLLYVVAKGNVTEEGLSEVLEKRGEGNTSLEFVDLFRMTGGGRRKRRITRKKRKSTRRTRKH